MRKSIKAIIGILTCLVLITIINVDGYTYNYNRDPIYSPDGFVSTTPKYSGGLNIPSGEFNSPEDLFVFTDKETKEQTIYIADSSSNKIFVFDSNYSKLATISNVTMDVSKFTDAQLQAIKSSGKYVISRNQPISIPYEMEKVYLSLEAANFKETPLVYELHEQFIPTDSILEWRSDNEAVAKYESIKVDGVDTNEKIVGVSVGNAKIIAEFAVYTTIKVVKEELVDGELKEVEKDEIVRTVAASASIDVVVTEEKQVVTRPPKNHSFSLSEIRAVSGGKVQLEFSSLSGIYRSVTPNVADSDYLYISDIQNNQIYVVKHDMVNEEYEVVMFVTVPDDISFNGKNFQPVKVVTDAKGRIYVISNNVYEGIIQFSAQGKFDRFTGVNYVRLTPWEIFWRNFSTDAQLAKQSTIINTSFTGMTVDNEGFIYATSYALTNSKGLVTDDMNMIKRINPLGKDVLRRNGYHPPMGDVEYIAASNEALIKGPSRFTGVTVNEYGVYTVLDSKFGRLFTYDREGNLLYISGNAYLGGTNATQDNILNNPVAISYLGEDILVLDKNKKALIVFEPTALSVLINEAVKLEADGKYIAAAEIWEEVVAQNANYEYAYIGIGKKYMALEEYETAMQFFKDGKNRQLYSRAFKMSRDAAIRVYFAPVMGTGIILIALLYIYKLYKRRGKPKAQDTGIGDE